MASEKIGIIGFGATFSKSYDLNRYDKYLDLDEFALLNEANMVFIMVPTPFDYHSKTSDDSAITETLDLLESISFDSKKPVVIKSTVVPKSCEFYSSNYDLEIVFNPEFLRESTSPFEDFANQKTVVIGTKSEIAYRKVKEIYEKVLLEDTEYFHTSYITAEMLKISQNVTLASRVAVANIVYDACQKYGASYEDIKKIGFDKFSVLGPHMVEVPGHDGKRGFGGKCLPKDINAFNSIFYSEILANIISYNETLRDDLN